jgi:hypothetical protein
MRKKDGERGGAKARGMEERDVKFWLKHVDSWILI